MFFKCAWKIWHFKSLKFVCHFLLRLGHPMQISHQCCYHESKAAVYSSTPTKSVPSGNSNSKTKLSWKGESSRVLNQVPEQRLRWIQTQTVLPPKERGSYKGVWLRVLMILLSQISTAPLPLTETREPRAHFNCPPAGHLQFIDGHRLTQSVGSPGKKSFYWLCAPFCRLSNTPNSQPKPETFWRKHGHKPQISLTLYNILVRVRVREKEDGGRWGVESLWRGWSTLCYCVCAVICAVSLNFKMFCLSVTVGQTSETANKMYSKSTW